MVPVEEVTPQNVTHVITEPLEEEDRTSEAMKIAEVIGIVPIGVHVLSYLFISEVLLKVVYKLFFFEVWEIPRVKKKALKKQSFFMGSDVLFIFFFNMRSDVWWVFSVFFMRSSALSEF